MRYTSDELGYLKRRSNLGGFVMSKGSRVGMMNAFGAATGTISMLVLLTGSGSAVVGAPAEFQLTAASAPSGADVSTTVPPSETVF